MLKVREVVEWGLTNIIKIWSFLDLTLVGKGPMLVGNGPTLVGNGPTLVGNGPSLMGNGPTLVGNGPTLVGNGPTLVGNGPTLVEYRERWWNIAKVLRSSMFKAKSSIDHLLFYLVQVLVTPYRLLVLHHMTGYGVLQYCVLLGLGLGFRPGLAWDDRMKQRTARTGRPALATSGRLRPGFPVMNVMHWCLLLHSQYSYDTPGGSGISAFYVSRTLYDDYQQELLNGNLQNKCPRFLYDRMSARDPP